MAEPLQTLFRSLDDLKDQIDGRARRPQALHGASPQSDRGEDRFDGVGRPQVFVMLRRVIIVRKHSVQIIEQTFRGFVIQPAPAFG